jgi:hypothetical protein
VVAVVAAAETAANAVAELAAARPAPMKVKPSAAAAIMKKPDRLAVAKGAVLPSRRKKTSRFNALEYI